MGPIFAIVLCLLAIFLILLVLVQRGRGGGLAGALGGMGGSSAFGAKAGDVFTRITIITASIWIVFCLAALMWAKHRPDALSGSTLATPNGSMDTGMLPEQKATQPASPTAAGESKSVPAAGPVTPYNPSAPTAKAPPVTVPAASPPPAAAPPTNPPVEEKK